MLICPSKKCPNHKKPIGNWYVKIGYYTSKSTKQTIQRYRCKSCDKSFSDNTNQPTANHKQPELNQLIFPLLVSGVSLRRTGLILGVRYDTVVYHFNNLAKQAKAAHVEHLKTLKTSVVMIDELETFIHARPKCVSVPMVVRVKTGEILGFSVARMSSKGKLAEIGKTKYSWTVNERKQKFQTMLRKLRGNFKPVITIKSDGCPSYGSWILEIVKRANHIKIISGTKKSKGSHDPLFSINNAFAKMRHDMNRLGRETWSTTKSIEGLENHLWLYVAWNNGYQLA